MRYAIFQAVFAACCFPLIAAAQPGPVLSPPGGPPPDMTAARTAAVNALSTDHRAKVQAVVDRVRAGGTTLCGGATSIDAILTPTERQQVLAQEKNMFFVMSGKSTAPGGAPPLPPPGAVGYRVVQRGTGATGTVTRAVRANIQPDPGEVLLMLLLPPPE